MSQNRTHIRIPPQAERALALLEAAGFESWLVGGFVRDALMGRAAEDIDIATAARWEQTEAVFEAAGCPCYRTGAQHGTVSVSVDGSIVEITTYRSDGSYSDSRHPDEVVFVSSIRRDLARRDFTINAMAYHPERGLLDPFGGFADLKAKIIRCVGQPQNRLGEDALRILRAARFESQLGFDIDRETAGAMRQSAPNLARVSAERQQKEWTKLLCGEFVHHSIMHSIDVLGASIPELLPMKGFDQRTPFHCYDVLEHTAYVVQLVDPEPRLRWAALLHDIGKPATFTVDEKGQGHFKGHPAAGRDIASRVVERMKLPKRFSEEVVTLVAKHDMPLIADAAHVQRAVCELGGDPLLFADLCKLKWADAVARTNLYARPRALRARELLVLLDRMMEQGGVWRRDMLAIDGTDLIEAGFETGPQVGEALDALLCAVMDGAVPNEREQLIGYARAWRRGNGPDGDR